jgi:hypothetical protein
MSVEAPRFSIPGFITNEETMSKKTRSNSRHKPQEIEAMFKNRGEGGASEEQASARNQSEPQDQDPKRRIGQFGGTGEPPLMKK